MKSSLGSRFVFTSLMFVLVVSIGACVSIEINQKHIFLGERFQVVYKDAGPVNYEAQLKFVDQAKEFQVEAGEGENFTKVLEFTAPDKPGNYTLEYPGGKLIVSVEEPVLVIEEFRVDGEVKRNSTLYVYYKIKCPGLFSALNVTRRLDIVPGDGYTYEPERKLVDILNPGEEAEERIMVEVGENAKNAKAILEIKYTYDGETHFLYKELDLRYGDFTWWPYLILLAIGGVLVYALRTRRKQKLNEAAQGP